MSSLRPDRPASSLLSSLRPRYPQGSTNSPAASAATAAAAVNEQPAQSEQAAALQATGMDALEVAKFPDFPSLFERFNEMERLLEQIAALLHASLPQPPIYEVLHIGVQGSGARVNKHGRKYLGFRSQAAGPLSIDFATATGKFTLAVTNSFQFLLIPDGGAIYGDTADLGNVEFVYLDEMPGGGVS